MNAFLIRFYYVIKSNYELWFFQKYFKNKLKSLKVAKSKDDYSGLVDGSVDAGDVNGFLMLCVMVHVIVYVMVCLMLCVMLCVMVCVMVCVMLCVMLWVVV